MIKFFNCRVVAFRACVVRSIVSSYGYSIFYRAVFFFVNGVFMFCFCI